MSSPLQSLIVKEWHEQKWRCASLSAICLSVVVFTMLRDPETTMMASLIVMLLQALLGSVFIAMGVAAGERSAGTFELLRALPVRMPKVAAAKLIAGAATCLAPMLLVLTTATTWLGAVHLLASMGHEFSIWLLKNGIGMYADGSEFFIFAAAIFCCCVSVFLWTVAVGVNQRTESRVGLMGIGMLGVWWMAIAFTQWLHGNPIHSEYLYSLALIVGISPFGGYILLKEMYQHVWPVIAAQVLSGCLLIIWTLCRYGRMTRNDNVSPAPEPVGTADVALTPPRRSPFMAVAWKQWRDTAPMVALALVLIAIAVAFPIMHEFRNRDTANAIYQVKSQLASIVRYQSTTVGVLLALVVGVGTFVSDYQPAMLTFWRSRPISPRLWFWSKYLIGLLVVELTMISPWIMAQVATGWYDFGIGPGYLGTVTVLHLFIYTASVWMACLLRHTVYAIIMAAGITALVLLTPTIEPSLNQFSIASTMASLAGEGLTYRFAAYYTPYLCWMLPPTALALWLATRAARRDSAFEFGR